jgi:translation initiation factor IF-3
MIDKRNNMKGKRRRFKINEEISSKQVRLLSDSEPIVISTNEALVMAKNKGKDLILINENQDPPIVKIEEYTRYVYNLEKLEKEKKKNSNKSELKETQLSVNISDHDLETKSRKSKDFLKNGDKVKVVISLKGRQKANPERGEIVMLKFAQSVEEFGVPENLPKLEGGKWLMIIKPKKK